MTCSSYFQSSASRQFEGLKKCGISNSPSWKDDLYYCVIWTVLLGINAFWIFFIAIINWKGGIEGDDSDLNSNKFIILYLDDLIKSTEELQLIYSASYLIGLQANF